MWRSGAKTVARNGGGAARLPGAGADAARLPRQAGAGAARQATGAPSRAGIILVVLGAVLVAAALLLYLCNAAEDKRAGEGADALLRDVQALIAERAAEAASLAPEDAAYVPPEPEFRGTGLPEVDIYGYGCIGYLSVPAVGLELPVFAEWDYERLKIAPCRQFGSPLTDDFVIAGHNYRRHFWHLQRLTAGDAVSFTDMDGNVHSYVVVRVGDVDPTDVAAVQDSGHALVLYTCTADTRTRVTVFCDRVGE